MKLELANDLGEAERHLNNGDFAKTEEICQNIISSGMCVGCIVIVEVWCPEVTLEACLAT